MKPVINYINSLLFPLLPETSCFALKRGLLRLAGAKIGKNVRICSSVHIMGCGELVIGKNSVVAAGAVVTKDVFPYCCVAGIPANVIKIYDK